MYDNRSLPLSSHKQHKPYYISKCNVLQAIYILMSNVCSSLKGLKGYISNYVNRKHINEIPQLELEENFDLSELCSTLT